MGDASSSSSIPPLVELSTDALVAVVESIGPAFGEYSAEIRNNGVDGADVATHVADGTLDDLFEALNITNKLHRGKLARRFGPSASPGPTPKQPTLPAEDTLVKMVADVPTMVFGDTQVYRDGLSGRLGELTRSVQQEFEQNEGGKWLPELSYVQGKAKERYPGPPKGEAPSLELVPAYTRDLGHDEWTVQRFWEAQPDRLRRGRGWADRNSPGGSPNELTELEVLMLRCWTGPVFKSWNFFLRFGPDAVPCCTSQPYHEHHKNNLVFCPRDDQPNVCLGCGKRRDEHFAQPMASWSTCISILYLGITKVATASKPATVYRGVNEKRIQLPQSFWDASASSGGFAGGVERAAMSTTTDRGVAGVFSGDARGSIFEITFDAASPGADLQFLSQFPAEREFLYPPGTQLTCMEVHAEGSKRVLKLRAAYQPDTLLKARASSIRSLEQVPGGVAGPSSVSVQPSATLAVSPNSSGLPVLELERTAPAPAASDANAEEQLREAEAAGEGDIYAALQTTCKDLGYDASHEKRVELKGLLEGVQGGEKFPCDIMDALKETTRKGEPEIDKALRPQLAPVIASFTAAIKEEEARRAEIARLEAEAKAEEAQKLIQEEARMQARLQSMGACPAGFAWHREGPGWRCNGGSHYVDNLH